MQKGLIHIYTGDGKGKTTAAVGLAVRAKSRGLRPLFVQFFKENNQSGEQLFFDKTGIQSVNFANVRSPFFNPAVNKDELRGEVKKALGKLNEIFFQGNFDIIVLDEFICLVGESLLSEEEAVDFIKSKPENLELVMTGRGATEKMIEIADYVTFMQKIKHPYKKNIKGRKGIEF